MARYDKRLVALYEYDPTDPGFIAEFADVVRVLGISSTRLKNWSVGRPLKITPSVRASRGKGSRNWYGEADLYKLYLAMWLTDNGGFSPAVIQQLLPQVEAELHASLAYPWLVVGDAGQWVEHFKTKREAMNSQAATTPGWYTINLQEVVNVVKNKIERWTGVLRPENRKKTKRYR